MKLKLTIIGIFLFSFTLSAGVVDKSSFDLSAPGLAKTGSVQNGPFNYQTINTDELSITLINGAYFTIGTNQGVSDSRLDDNCGVTFGHPFAKTSYPVFSIDGSWYKPAEYFLNPDQSILWKSGDTLGVTFMINGLLTYEFMMFAPANQSHIKLAANIVNEDTVNHSYGGGLVIDPALGKWGDGKFQFNEDILKMDTVFTSISTNTSCKIWERGDNVNGLIIDLAFDDNPPAKMIAANWQDIYDNHSPEFALSDLRLLYDLAVKLIWNEVELAPSEKMNHQITIELQQPHFNSTAFLRWDIPRVFSMTNNSLFPREFNTYLEINNQNEIAINNGNLNVSLPVGFKADVIDYTVDAAINQTVFQKISLGSQLIYEDMIVDLIVTLKNGSHVLDEIIRPVYLPATALSDTGLIITNDSLSIDDHPQIDVIFGIEIESSGHKILDLRDENIFLYENNQRVREFNLSKYSITGSNLADIVFVLDCSGSMGNEIDEVRDNLGEFADSLVAKGYDFQIGVVTFSTTVDDVWDFTNDVEQVKQNLGTVSLWGGIEDSPAALYRATELSWRDNSRRTIIWITDEPYPETSYTKEQIVDRMLAMGITVHGIGLTNLQTDWFNPVLIPTGGNFYNIYGNFRDIMIDVTNFTSQFIYSLKYTSPDPSAGANVIKLEIHYEGLGVIYSVVYNFSGKAIQSKHLSCYPNPFNPEITLLIDKQEFIQGDITIFNILGQKVKNISLNQNPSQKIVWNAINDVGARVGSGYYIVRLSLKNQNGERHHEYARILYLK